MVLMTSECVRMSILCVLQVNWYKIWSGRAEFLAENTYTAMLHLSHNNNYTAVQCACDKNQISVIV